MRAALVLLFGLGLSGCGAWIYSPLNGPPNPVHATSPQAIEIFTTQRPSKPFVEVGQFAVPTGAVPDEGWMKKLREQAGEKGCDALVMTSAAQQTYTCIVYNP
jgi:hypothetical protein